jgi:hypothetical protein
MFTLEGLLRNRYLFILRHMSALNNKYNLELKKIGPYTLIAKNHKT